MIDRRRFLTTTAAGFGAIAFDGLLPRIRSADVPLPHYAPKAQSVIFLYMDGGPSAMDTFDPKPRLTKEDGKKFGMKMEPTQFNNNGNTLGSPWKFRRYGESGLEVSDLFPHVGRCADKLAVVRSMYATFSEHTNANYFLHTGHGLQGRPSMGAWVNYGLGSPNDDLPGFVVLDTGLTPPGGLDNFGSAFLSAKFQASVFKNGNHPVANIRPADKRAELQRNKLALVQDLDESMLASMTSAGAIDAAMANYDLAYRMQSAIPELANLDGESDATKTMYGLEHAYEPTRLYGRHCLLARRLVERGVRFIELTCPNVSGDRWDQHGNLKQGHENNARAVDQPIAALLKDLEQRGLLDHTLVVWAGEFGRTPFAQGRNGRDHNPFGFTIWMAGAGIRGGTVYGATDEYGYHAVEGRTTFHDLHATMLHLLGIDHERLTYRFSGRDIRLTDVHGHRIEAILA